METRARRQSLRVATASVPSEIWLLILSFLEPKQSVQAALVCSEFRSVSRASAQKGIERLWPQQKARLIAKFGQLGVQKVLALISQHESEAKAHPDVQKACHLQKLVQPEHRQIAVEWLIEVAWDWQLESTVVYRGTQYLDQYLATHPVPALSKFQMLAISSLRTALKHSSKLAERERAKLPYKHWAEVTDGACTEAEVRSTCAKMERLLQAQQRSHPNAKQRLRYLWYRLYDAGVVKQEHVYAYMLASFLLHLSLLETALSAITPTLLATAALSLALEVFGFEPWPQALQEHCWYLPQELQEVQDKLRKAQEELPAKQLRALWVHSYSYIGTNPLQQPAYSHLQLIVSVRGKLQQLHALLSAAGSRTGSNGSSEVVAAAAAAAASAAAVLEGAHLAAAAGMPPAAAVVAAAAGPVDGTVIVGVVPAAAAAAAAPGAAAAPEAVLLPPAPLGRVTRAAAAAGQQQQQQRQHTQQQQNQPAAINTRLHGIAGATRMAANGASLNGMIMTSQHLQTRQQQQQQLASGDRLLPTPQRTSIAPLAEAGHAAAARHHNIVGAASLMAGLASDNHNAHRGSSAHQPLAAHALGSSNNGAAASSSASAAASRRFPTRELPARRAVASSKYGCRGTSAAGSSSGAAAAASGNAGGSGSVGTPAAVAGFKAPVTMTGDNSSFSAATAAPPAGSTTPSSPKHAAAVAGHRGLAALFAGASCNMAGSSSNVTGAAAGTRSHTRTSVNDSVHLRFDADDIECRKMLEGTSQPAPLSALPQQKRGIGQGPTASKLGQGGRATAGSVGGGGISGLDEGLAWSVGSRSS